MIKAIRVTSVSGNGQEAGEDVRLVQHEQLLGQRDGMGAQARDDTSIAGSMLKISKKWGKTTAALMHR
jgi:hypothetical protein